MNSFVAFAQICRTWDCGFSVEMGTKDVMAIVKSTTIIGDEAKFEEIWSDCGLVWEKNFRGDYVFLVELV